MFFLVNAERGDIVDQCLGMDDRIGHAFQDDQDFIAKRQDLFGKRLNAHAEIQDDKACQPGELLDERFIVGGLVDQMHIAWAVRGKQQFQSRGMMVRALRALYRA